MRSCTSEAVPTTLATAKVTAIMGATAFIIDKFLSWVLKEEEALETPLGLGVAIVFVTASGVTTVLTRFFNMKRQGNQAAHNNATDHHGWSYEGIPMTRPLQIGRHAVQTSSRIYVSFSALSGFLSTFSLAKLRSMMMHGKFDISCKNPDASVIEISCVHAGALVTSLASVRSYKTYNEKKLQEYYKEYFIEGKIKQVSRRVFAEVFLSLAVGSIGAFYANKTMLEMLNNNSFCYLNSAVQLPPQVIFGLSGLSCASNFVVTGLMTVAGKDKEEKGETKTTRAETLKLLSPFWNLMNPVFLFCILMDSINSAGFGASVSFAKLPETIDGEKYAGWSYHLELIIPAVLMGIIAIRNYLPQSTEGYNTELKIRAKDRATRNSSTTILESLSQPLLNSVTQNNKANLPIKLNRNSPNRGLPPEGAVEIGDMSRHQSPALATRSEYQPPMIRPCYSSPQASLRMLNATQAVDKASCSLFSESPQSPTKNDFDSEFVTVSLNK